MSSVSTVWSRDRSEKLVRFNWAQAPWAGTWMCPLDDIVDEAEDDDEAECRWWCKRGWCFTFIEPLLLVLGNWRSA